jgi:protein-tyrosine phosphatase
MRQHEPKGVLFLCTGNYYRSRFAEILFNSVAVRRGLAWRASSRGLALERGTNNIGPIAPSAVAALARLGIGAGTDVARFPIAVSLDDFERANCIIALQEAEHRPLLAERFPSWVAKVEYWQVADDAAALALIEREVLNLTARLRAGLGSPRGGHQETVE